MIAAPLINENKFSYSLNAVSKEDLWRPELVNEGISLIELIMNASFAVQTVMLILFILSIVSWVIIVQRWLVLSSAQKGLFGFEQRFWSGMDLSQLYKEGSQMQQDNIPVVGMENIFKDVQQQVLNRIICTRLLRLIKCCHLEQK